MYNTIKDLPKNAYICKHYLQFYRLKEKKRYHYEDNLELKLDMEYYVYSEFSDGWYRRQVTGHLDPIELTEEIKRGNVMVTYTESEIHDIIKYKNREGIKSNNEYINRMWAEYKQSTQKGRKRYDKAWYTKDKGFSAIRS